MARFRQLHTDDPHRHHDALEFANGVLVMVNNLATGQRARVLQLPPIPDKQQPPARTIVETKPPELATKP